MRLLPALVALTVCLGGLFALPASAATDAELSVACVKCHDAEDLPDMSRAPHAPQKRIADPADARIPNCVTCHGPSPTHVTKPPGGGDRPPPDVAFSKKSPNPSSQRNATCLGCHQKDPKRALWGGSQHESADLACSSCHQVHTNRDKVMAKVTEKDVCYTCHKEQRAQHARPSHHPVPEGKMGCSDCHNTHGSAGPKLASRDSVNATCYTCHAEKRGPFVHTHEPVSEDCTICHNPHGSTVAAMLKTRAPMLCQQCHTPHVAGGVGALAGQRGVFPPAAPGQVAPAISANSNGKNVVNLWQGRSCMNCHTQLHGSNNPSATNPTPNFLTR